MQIEIDLAQGIVRLNGGRLWTVGEDVADSRLEWQVRYLDLPATLVIVKADGNASSAAILFDEEEFPDSILTSRIVKRFAKKSGVWPTSTHRARAVARSPENRSPFRWIRGRETCRSASPLESMRPSAQCK